MEEILGSDIWVIRNLLSRVRNVLRPVYMRENSSRPHLPHPELTGEVNFMELSAEFSPHLSTPG